MPPRPASTSPNCWAAQTALRDMIGRTTLTDLLRGREQIEAATVYQDNPTALHLRAMDVLYEG